MRRTRRSPPDRDDGRRLDGVLTARDSGRRAGRGGVTAPPLWREQIGQLASRRLWRQKVGTNTQSRTAHQQLAGRGLAVRLSLAMVPGLATTAGAAPGAILVDSHPAPARRIFAAVRRYLWQERAFLPCTTA